LVPQGPQERLAPKVQRARKGPGATGTVAPAGPQGAAGGGAVYAAVGSGGTGANSNFAYTFLNLTPGAYLIVGQVDFSGGASCDITDGSVTISQTTFATAEHVTLTGYYVEQTTPYGTIVLECSAPFQENVDNPSLIGVQVTTNEGNMGG
jgi:hypothetical protein